MVRRRTCPGVDGRKNRFLSSSGSRKSSGDNRSKGTSTLDSIDGRDPSSAEESSLGDTSDDDSRNNARKHRKKRSSASFGSARGPRGPYAKRSRHSLGPNAAKPGSHCVESNLDESVVVDLSLVSSGSPGSLTGQGSRSSKDDDVDETSLSDRDERTEMIEQSLVVSQVAMKLEEYARKAKKGQSRTRRGDSQGVVTPPHGQLPTAFSSAHGLLTYDDEYESADKSSGKKSPKKGQKHAAGDTVVTDGDDSLTSDDERVPSYRTVKRVITPDHQAPKKMLCARPVADTEVVKTVTQHLLASTTNDSEGSMVVSSVVASFCMTTPPSSSDDLCSQILRLISSYECLAVEFQQYRSALHPQECSIDLLPSCTFTPGFRNNQAVSVQQIWLGASSRSAAVRDFKTFAVNRINWVLDQMLENGGKVALSEVERSALSHTARVWWKSASATF